MIACFFIHSVIGIHDAFHDITDYNFHFFLCEITHKLIRNMIVSFKNTEILKILACDNITPMCVLGGPHTPRDATELLDFALLHWHHLKTLALKQCLGDQASCEYF